MQDVYRKDAKLGDPRSLNKQLEAVAQELDRLKQELNKFEVIFIFIITKSRVNVKQIYSYLEYLSCKICVGRAYFGFVERCFCSFYFLMKLLI